ncbi:hypothetical protein DYB90_17830 [Vibrio cholerae]|nr:hypothetical protein [Vibrio cholerae]
MVAVVVFEFSVMRCQPLRRALCLSGANLNWYELLTAASFGAIAVKLLDILWMQRVIHKSDKQKWLREQRLKAYSKLATEILSLGREFQTREDVFKGYALAAEAILLTDDKKLADKIETYFTMLSNLYAEALRDPSDPLKKSDSQLDGAYAFVIKDSRELVDDLRKSLNR